jgi:hypothetical protein
VLDLSAEALDPSALAGGYPAQSVPLPEVDAFVADATASGGRFTGDYFGGSNLPLHVSFDFLASEVLPSLLLFRLVGIDGVATNTFFTSLTNQLAAAGHWQHVTVPLQYGPGAWSGPGAAAFTNSLTDVRQLEVAVLRSGTNAQAYVIDNFTLASLVPGAPGTNDLDGDGLPDYWEVEHFGGPTNAPAGVDTDHDTLSNWAEFISGTDPRDSRSFLRIGGVAADGAGYTAWLTSVLGRTYQLGWKHDLNDATWTWSTNWVGASGGYIGLTDTNGASPSFYRLRAKRDD